MCGTSSGSFRPPRLKKVGRAYNLDTRRGREAKKRDSDLVEIRRKWIKAAKRGHAWENKYLSVLSPLSVAFCRRHFPADSVFMIGGKYRLRTGVVPQDPAGEDQLTEEGFIKTGEHRRQVGVRSNPEALAAAEAAVVERKRRREEAAAERRRSGLMALGKKELVDKIFQLEAGNA